MEVVPCHADDGCEGEEKGKSGSSPPPSEMRARMWLGEGSTVEDGGGAILFGMWATKPALCGQRKGRRRISVVDRGRFEGLRWPIPTLWLCESFSILYSSSGAPSLAPYDLLSFRCTISPNYARELSEQRHCFQEALRSAEQIQGARSSAALSLPLRTSCTPADRAEKDAAALEASDGSRERAYPG